MVGVFTGIRNADMEKKIIDNGGIIGSSISGKTTIVIAKDPNANTSKLNGAREQGIEIVNITDFEKKYLIG
jgi:NAD-dependent DNA ligase